MDTQTATIDEYLATVPPEARTTLEELRRRISALAPDAVESIAYGMPTFKYLGKPLIHFAAAKKHLAVYGVPGGTFRFSPGQPPGEDTVRAWLAARISQIEAKAGAASARRAE